MVNPRSPSEILKAIRGIGMDISWNRPMDHNSHPRTALTWVPKVKRQRGWNRETWHTTMEGELKVRDLKTWTEAALVVADRIAWRQRACSPILNNPDCRLINPSKTEIGVISNHLLDNINSTKVDLRRSTSHVIEWFNAIPEKCQHAFITLDICKFYPSISEELLMKALDYASRFTQITQQDWHIIHSKRSLLYHQNSP